MDVIAGILWMLAVLSPFVLAELFIKDMDKLTDEKPVPWWRKS